MYTHLGYSWTSVSISKNQEFRLAERLRYEKRQRRRRIDRNRRRGIPREIPGGPARGSFNARRNAPCHRASYFVVHELRRSSYLLQWMEIRWDSSLILKEKGTEMYHAIFVERNFTEN